MDQRLTPGRIAANRDRYLTNAEDIEHIELPGSKGRDIPPIFRLKFQRKSIRYFISYVLHPVALRHHGITLVDCHNLPPFTVHGRGDPLWSPGLTCARPVLPCGRLVLPQWIRDFTSRAFAVDVEQSYARSLEPIHHDHGYTLHEFVTEIVICFTLGPQARPIKGDCARRLNDPSAQMPLVRREKP